MRQKTWRLWDETFWGASEKKCINCIYWLRKTTEARDQIPGCDNVHGLREKYKMNTSARKRDNFDCGSWTRCSARRCKKVLQYLKTTTVKPLKQHTKSSHSKRMWRFFWTLMVLRKAWAGGEVTVMKCDWAWGWARGRVGEIAHEHAIECGGVIVVKWVWLR